MTLKTETITYNVRERGRKSRGQDRNFDTVALARMINGASIQEKVKHGDMNGYFGHWPRLKLGMEPSEGGIVDGKVVSIAPALRTIELRADDDGTIYHKAEFLDTNEGQIAAKMYLSKSGGFSSAIDAVPGTNPYVPAGFYGFDYVLEPNYTTNRGYALKLDSVGTEAQSDLMAMLDSAMHESTEAAAILNGMFDGLHSQHLLALATIERMARENDDLIGRIAKGGTHVLDGLIGGERIAPTMELPVPDYERYRTTPLERLQQQKSEAMPDTPEGGYLRRRFGIGS